MGRKRTRLKLCPGERRRLNQRLKTTFDSRVRERLRFALGAATGRYTLAELADRAGRVRATIQNWLLKFTAGGIDGLLQRESPPGNSSPIETDTVQRSLRAGLKAGRWHSAVEVARWLEEKHGIRRARKTIYYWLAKLGRHERAPVVGSRRHKERGPSSRSTRRSAGRRAKRHA